MPWRIFGRGPGNRASAATPAGSPAPISASASAFTSAPAPAATVTDRRASAPAATAALDLTDMLSDNAERLVAGVALATVLERLTHDACRLAGSDPSLGLIRVVDPERLIFRLDVRGDGTTYRPKNEVSADKGVIGRAMRLRAAQVVDDVAATPDPDYVEVDDGVRSELAVPVLAGDQCWGVLNLESRQPAAFGRHLIASMQAIAAQAALAIKYDDLRRREQQERIAQLYGADVDRFQSELRVIAEEALRKLPQRRASVEVLVLSPEHDALVTQGFATDNPSRALPGRFAAGTTLAWDAVARETDIDEPDVAPDNTRTSVSGSRCVLALPLRVNGAVAGVFNVEAPQPHALDGARATLQIYRDHAEQVLQSSGADARKGATNLSRMMGQVGKEIAQLVDPAEAGRVYSLVLRLAVQMIGKPNLKAAIALWSDGHLTITEDRTWNYTPEMLRTWSWDPNASPGLTGAALRSRQSVLVADVDDPPPGITYLPQDPTTHCELVVPMFLDGQPVGIIDIISPEVGAITATHQQSIEALAGQVVQALQRVKEIEQGRAAQEHEKVVRETSERITNMLAQKDIRGVLRARREALEMLVQRAMEVTKSEHGSIMGAVHVPSTTDQGGRTSHAEMVLMLVWPLRTDFALETHFPADHGVTAQVYHSGAPQILSNVSDFPGFIPLLGNNVQSELAVPIGQQPDVRAVLNLESATQHWYSPEQVQAVQLFASQAANVLNAADQRILRIQQELLNRLGQQVMIESRNEDGDPINKALQREILRAALEVVSDPETSYASFWLVRGDGLERAQRLVQDESTLGPEPPRVTTEGLVGRIRKTQQPVLVLDATEPPWNTTLLDTWPPVKSSLGVPLLDPDLKPGDPHRVLGVLNVESPNKLDFTDRDIPILEQLAQLAVVAMRNREVYRGKARLLRDVTHALKKAIYPLQIEALNLQALIDPTSDDDGVEAVTASWRQAPSEAPSTPEVESVRDIVSFADLAADLLGWFQALVTAQETRAQIPMTAVNITATVTNMVNRLHPLAETRQKRLIPDIQLDGQTRVTCSENLVKAALFLLIENALTYAPEGDTVVVRLAASGDPQHPVRIDVVDHGAAVAQSDRDRIFEEGFSGGTHAARHADRAAGSGVGLYHVKTIVETIHHGVADYKPDVDGNHFYMDLR